MAMLLCMSVHPFAVNFTSASISSALPIYAGSPIFGLPPKPFSTLTHLAAVNILMLGFSNLWWVPLANTFGRRPITLISLLLLIFSSMWAGLTTNFNSLLAARIFMGIGGGPADAVSPDVVGEIFFVHQRGRAMVGVPPQILQICSLTVPRPSIPYFCPSARSSAASQVATSFLPWD